MRLLIQRVRHASVTVDQNVVGEIGPGLLVFLGVGHDDTRQEADILAGKLSRLRIFEDDAGRMNLDVRQIEGSVLVVSQFTLYADTQKGNRPSFVSAAKPDVAEELYLYFVEALNRLSIPTQTGLFGAMMDVSLLNDGPVTLMLEQ